MKNFIKIALAGILVIFLAMAFIKNNINAFTWHEDTRVIFILSCLGWIVVASMIKLRMDDL